MERAEFEEFRSRLHNDYQFVIIDVDSKGDEVAICRKSVASNLRIGINSFSYASSLICRCHWSEVQAWYHGYEYGLRRTDKQDIIHKKNNTVEKLEELELHLKTSEEPTQFHIVKNDYGDIQWEIGKLGQSPPEGTPTYRTLSEVERWLEGRLYGIAKNIK